MALTSDEMLRALIRLIPPARALKEDLEKSIHLGLYSGTGDLAIKSFQGIQASVARLTGDPYVEALTLDAHENATDKEKVSLALLAAGQLAAYLEGQTGLVNLGGESHGSNLQTAPNINISGITGLMSETVDKIVEIGLKGMEGEEKES